MLKIFGKAAVLVFIILSIYFIVNPSACSNLLAGRVVNTPRSEQPQIHPSMPPARGEVLPPAGDKPAPAAQTAPDAQAAPEADLTDSVLPPQSLTIPVEETATLQTTANGHPSSNISNQ